MFKTRPFFLLAIISFALPAIAQNANKIPGQAPIPEKSTVRGRVYYEDTGRPVKRASLMLMSEGTNPGQISALTDAEGNFVIKNVRAGTYYAVINAPGVVTPLSYVDFSRIGPGNDGDRDAVLEQAFSQFDRIMVDGINEVYTQIPAKRGGAISGRVIYENGDPAVGVKAEVLRKVNGKYVSVISNFSFMMSIFSGGTGSGQTDDRGVYRFAGLPGGEYVIKVSESAQHTDSERREGPGELAFLLFGTSSLLTFYFPDATSLQEAQIINVLQGQEQGEINITIHDKSLFNLSGKVVSRKDKKPLARAKVSLRKKGHVDSSLSEMMSRELNSAVTDEEGNWKFKEIPKGDYSITVEPNNNSGGPDYYPDDDEEYPREAKPKTPPPPKYAKAFKDAQLEDKDVADVIIELGYGANIAGTVTTENSKEMPQNITIRAMGDNNELLAATVVWNYKNEGFNSNTPQQAPKVDNDFSIENIAAGKVTLKFQVSDSSYYVKSARSGMIDLMTTPLDLKEGESLSGIKIVFANDVGTLKGKILAEEDRPAPGVALMLVPTDEAKRRSSNYIKNARSDSDGKFEVKLPPGEYAILFLKPGIADGDQAAFNSWRDEAMKNADKASISAEGVTNVTLRRPSQ